MSLYLCVDCGGSKTSAVISSASGEILGRALAGPSNFAYLGISLFTAAVTTAISTAFQTCTSSPSTTPIALPPTNESLKFASAWFGISGVDSPAAIAALTPVLSKLLGIPPGPRLIIAHDAHLLAAPVRLHPDVSQAVAVIAGTGSCIVSFRETSSGTLEELGRTGGWGWILSDEGGGFHVGREAIRQIVLETDRSSLGGVPPINTLPGGQKSLRRKVLELFGIDHALELLTVIHLPDPTPSTELNPSAPAYMHMVREKRLSSLSPLVFQSAFEDQDPLALTVLRIATEALADQILLVLNHDLGPRAVKASESVVCFGGSLVGVEKYRQLVLDYLKSRGHVFRHIEFVGDAAAIGAVGLATQASSVSVPVEKGEGNSGLQSNTL